MPFRRIEVIARGFRSPLMYARSRFHDDFENGAAPEPNRPASSGGGWDSRDKSCLEPTGQIDVHHFDGD